MKTSISIFSAAIALAAGTALASSGHYNETHHQQDNKKEITIIHMGDLHGHTVPGPIYAVTVTAAWKAVWRACTHKSAKYTRLQSTRC